MQYSRTSIVVMLIAVEVVLAGLMIFVVHGGFSSGNVFAMSGMHRVSFTPTPIAPIAAGPSPHVVVDDPDSRVIVSASTDDLVHVVDRTSVGGLVWSSTGKIPQLKVTRTGDGVRIERAESSSGFFELAGFSRQRIEVQMPANGHLEVARSSGDDISELNNRVDVASQDGHISVAQINGDVDARSDDGRIEASDIHGNNVKLATSDGSMRLRNVNALALDAQTNDGRIDAQNLTIEGASPHATLHSGDGSVHVQGRFAAAGAYELSTNDGRVELTVASGSDVTVNAHTNDGKLVVDGQSFSGEDSSGHTVRVGNGTGTMRVTTGDGSIHITTNGAF